jgi:hypothetical protein
MATLQERLSKIENKLQTLIEGSAAKLFPGRQSTADMAYQLVNAMHSGLKQDFQGVSWAPNYYLIQLHPEEADFYISNPSLIYELTKTLDEAGIEAGFDFSGRVVVQIEADESITLGEIRVLAHNSVANLPQTSAIELPRRDDFGYQPASAFLIVDGTQIFSLHTTAVNIGRRADNDLVIDDQRVSRLHAQIRWVRGRYILFDLGSVGGTWVNKTRVNQSPLFPGDVISLAGVPLVFGLENESTDQTQELTLKD